MCIYIGIGTVFNNNLEQHAFAKCCPQLMRFYEALHQCQTMILEAINFYWSASVTRTVFGVFASVSACSILRVRERTGKNILECFGNFEKSNNNNIPYDCAVN